jgi:hypothetical protein
MNVLPLERQAQILSALVEGNSVRSTSRMSDARVGTILNLLVRVGNGCERLMERKRLDKRRSDKCSRRISKSVDGSRSDKR